LVVVSVAHAELCEPKPQRMLVVELAWGDWYEESQRMPLPVQAQWLLLDDLTSSAFAAGMVNKDVAVSATASHAVFIFMRPEIAARRGAGLIDPARNLIFPFQQPERDLRCLSSQSWRHCCAR
jgi:hypothetical protein